MNSIRLSTLVCKMLLWLPVCIGAWVLLADILNYPAMTLSGWMLKEFSSGWVESVELSNGLLTLVTDLVIRDYPGATPGQVAVMVAEINPSIYSYGLPIFIALMLATNGWHKIHHLLLGSLVLVPFQAWGLSFDLLKQIAITAPAAVIAQIDFAVYQREIIVLGYQFGYLIMPTLAPIAVWLSMNQKILSVQLRYVKKT